ncbi:MAG: hypothetical protein AB1646_25770 [Thermodesulfobacteriota bacterium]
MSENEDLMFMALAKGRSLKEAVAEAGLDETEQQRLLPTMLAAATVLKYKGDLTRGVGFTPEMLHLFREVTAPIVEAMNDQEGEMAALREDMKRLRQVHTDLRDVMKELLAMVLALKMSLGVADEPERTERPLKLVGGQKSPSHGPLPVAERGSSEAPSPFPLPRG